MANCQQSTSSYPQYYPIHTHFTLQQNHPTPQPTPATITQQPQHHHAYYQSTTSSSYFDLDRFNQQAKAAVKTQMNFINHHEQRNIKNHMNSVHQSGSEPHFNFMVNNNYSDLEKASEQFVDLGSLAAKQNLPKVIKITKTVAVKQPVPVPYPVPIVKVVKEQIPVHYNYESATTSAPVTEKNYEFKPSPYFSNYTSYMSKYPERSSAHKIAESYIKNELFSSSAAAEAGRSVHYDTRPFYIQTAEKEMTKYVPVPYYIDDDGNKHEIKNSALDSTQEISHQQHSDTDSYYNKIPSSTASYENSGKFQSYTFSYHPTTPSTTTMSAPPSYHQHHQHQYAPAAQPLYATPETGNKYYYSQNADNNVSPSMPTAQHYAYEQAAEESSLDGNDDQQHYQYKYVYEKRR